MALKENWILESKSEKGLLSRASPLKSSMTSLPSLPQITQRKKMVSHPFLWNLDDRYLNTSTLWKLILSMLASNWKEVGWAKDSIGTPWSGLEVGKCSSHQVMSFDPTQMQGHRFFLICKKVPLELAVALGMEVMDWQCIGHLLNSNCMSVPCCARFVPWCLLNSHGSLKRHEWSEPFYRGTKA